MNKPTTFRGLSALERFFNRGFGFLVQRGIGFSHSYLLVVEGRNSGRRYETPVNLLNTQNKRYLVAPRGETQWVRNVRSKSTACLSRGRTRVKIELTEIENDSKPAILKSYVEAYRSSVQRFFSVPADADVTRFAQIEAQHPVFEVTYTERSLGSA